MTDELSPTEVTAALRAAALLVTPNEESATWAMSFQVNGRDQPVLLLRPQTSVSSPLLREYFIALSPIVSDRLIGSLDQLSAEVMRTIFRVQTESLLARFDFWIDAAGAYNYVTMSPCSVFGVDGLKLRRRLEATAELAGKIRAALHELPLP